MIFFLIAVNIGYVIYTFILKTENKNVKFTSLELTAECEKIISNYNEIVLQLSENIGSEINKSIPLFDEYGIETSINKILSLSPVLIFKYFQRSCHSCVLDQLYNLNQVLNEVDLKKVIIITNDANFERIKDFKSKNQISFPIYSIKNRGLGLPVEKLSSPYLFILNNSAQPECLFIPIEFNDSLSYKYLRMVKKRYWEE